MRYAHNLLTGNGLLFNPGHRAGGFTSQVHLVVAIVAAIIPGGATLFTLKIASLVFACITAHGAVVPWVIAALAFLARP